MNKEAIEVKGIVNGNRAINDKKASITSFGMNSHAIKRALGLGCECVALSLLLLEIRMVDEGGLWQCSDQYLPPCAGFVEIMAPVFSRAAWRCVWHMIQNDLIHGWGLDFALRRCVETPHENIGVVDTQWIVHQSVPSLGNQGQAEHGRAPWEGVRERCNKEWVLFQDRMANAEKEYFQAMGLIQLNTS
ncbi:hypothetical protein PIB30_104497, partial [Stylosanthes scabra]|nr:hypothetical protein [Stylosanthes scabra]